jgi:hypothetical protein
LIRKTPPGDVPTLDYFQPGIGSTIGAPFDFIAYHLAQDLSIIF